MTADSRGAAPGLAARIEGQLQALARSVAGSSGVSEARRRLAARADRVRRRLALYRSARELDQLCSVLEGLSDRQLAALGLTRDRLFTEIEERFRAVAGPDPRLATETDATPGADDPAAEAPAAAAADPAETEQRDRAT